LINALNGGPASTQLASWLATTLPHMFGAACSANCLVGKTNADVAALFQKDFLLQGVKLDAQVLATALSVYATDATLDSTGAAAPRGRPLVHGRPVLKPSSFRPEQVSSAADCLAQSPMVRCNGIRSPLSLARRVIFGAFR